MITAISPIDGRYASKTKILSNYFSEYALIRYRIRVEIEYFIHLAETGKIPSAILTHSQIDGLRKIYTDCSLEDTARVKEIESTTNHDVKAVEYFIKEKIVDTPMNALKEFIHFGLTSQDINNTAVPLSIKEALEDVILPDLEKLTLLIRQKALSWKAIPMLAHTHGQPASPTGLGKEIYVFVERLQNQLQSLRSLKHYGKFGGATGNFNAHYIAQPKINWPEWADAFLSQKLGLHRYQTTTQIEHYDGLSNILHHLIRINTILIDFCRDLWTYISIEYFKQETVAGEIGSSAMPHKVNPIDFENAEGNLGIATSIAGHLAEKLPVSRLQRDLTDSTVLRNIGIPFAHLIISIQSIEKGLRKLVVNPDAIEHDLAQNWAVLAEAIQSVLRIEGYHNPYEALKELTRGKEINRDTLLKFIDSLEIDNEVKQRLRSLTPENYTGNALNFDEHIS